MFLVLGLLLGVDGPGGIRYDDTRFTYFVGSLALCVILFDGGLQTRAAQVRGSVAPSLMLATVGVAVTATLTALAAYHFLHLAPLQALLLGAVLASTDAAAVLFLLRAGGLHLERRTASTLEMESGANDPVAIFLTVGLTSWVAANDAPTGAIVSLAIRMAWAMGMGIALGYAGGRLIVWALNRFALPSGLPPWLAMAGAVALFAVTNRLGGSGYLAAYLAGIVVANRPLRARAEILSVQNATTWFAQLVMFLLLGLLAAPRHLVDVLWPALAVAASLMLVARPVAVLLCLAPFRYRAGEIGFIGWVGLRGAVSIFLASIPLLAKLPDAGLYFNVAFVVVLASLLVQGWTLARAAHWFGVAVPRTDPDTRRIQLDLPGQLEYDLVGYRVAAGCAALQGALLPGRVRLAMLVREGRILLADHDGAFAANDYVYFLSPTGQAHRLDWLFAEGRAARAAEQEAFGLFTLPGNVPLGELAQFYELKLPARLAAISAADLFDERFDGNPQVGDRLSLGRALLVVRALREERVERVGLKFTGLGERLITGQRR